MQRTTNSIGSLSGFHCHKFTTVVITVNSHKRAFVVGGGGRQWQKQKPFTLLEVSAPLEWFWNWYFKVNILVVTIQGVLMMHVEFFLFSVRHQESLLDSYQCLEVVGESWIFPYDQEQTWVYLRQCLNIKIIYSQEILSE